MNCKKALLYALSFITAFAIFFAAVGLGFLLVIAVVSLMLWVPPTFDVYLVAMLVAMLAVWALFWAILWSFSEENKLFVAETLKKEQPNE